MYALYEMRSMKFLYYVYI